jgi:hypothetical protein
VKALAERLDRELHEPIDRPLATIVAWAAIVAVNMPHARAR